MFSEISPSYELPPCCDVMGFSNLITVPDCVIFFFYKYSKNFELNITLAAQFPSHIVEVLQPPELDSL